jgi:hypothetical protein
MPDLDLEILVIPAGLIFIVGFIAALFLFVLPG